MVKKRRPTSHAASSASPVSALLLNGDDNSCSRSGSCPPTPSGCCQGRHAALPQELTVLQLALLFDLNHHFRQLVEARKKEGGRHWRYAVPMPPTWTAPGSCSWKCLQGI
ncbi:unnamed protein product [Urochloa humidicola]